MEAWLKAVQERTVHVIMPKSDFAKAMQYVRNHFVELTRYLDDGQVPMDNNDAEQLMRQVSLGRKNWLFAGSVAGGERNAGFLTLVSSALRNDLDVWVYVKDILDQLLAGSTNYQSLLPWNWAASHPEAIRKYRVKERRDRKIRKQFKRALRRLAAARLRFPSTSNPPRCWCTLTLYPSNPSNTPLFRGVDNCLNLGKHGLTSGIGVISLLPRDVGGLR